MSSPFPGMNPILEQEDVWDDFHKRFISAAAAAVEASLGPDYFIRIAKLPERHSFLEILDQRSRRLVTVVELLTPSNKAPGSDREQYLAKRGRTFASSAHLVEIDLLRGYGRMPMIDAPACDYCILVSRAEERPRARVWPGRLRDPLPTIPIPLQAGDADVRLDLQILLHRVYDAAGYAKYIDEESPSAPRTGGRRLGGADGKG